MRFSYGRCGLPILLWAVLAGGAPARADVQLRLERPDVEALEVLGFEIDRGARVRVNAIGLDGDERRGPRWFQWFDEDGLDVYGWLVDAATRRPVWVMERASAEPVSGSDRLWAVETSVRLEPGRYELYLYSGAVAGEPDERGRRDEGGWWDRLWSREGERRSVRADLEDCHVTLSLDGWSETDLRRFDVSGELAGSLLRHHRLGDSTLARGGFGLERRSRIRVYSIFEKSRGSSEAADYGWIVDAATHERVWDTDDAFDRDAGGDPKNRLVDDEITLEAGRYLVYFGTDDSHSFEHFNSAPPHDPFNWGITLLPGLDMERTAFFTFEPGAEPPPLIEFAAAGNGAFFEQPFRLAAGADLRVKALGEYGDGEDAFYDHAWIAFAGSERKAWEMSRSNTVPAGGSSKNRMFDGQVHLEPGDYVLYYVTDGSHSAEQWNSATPFEPEAWGVALRPGPGFDPADLVLLDPASLDDAGDYLVRIVRVGDDQERRQRFTLEEATPVRIRAMGEGSSGTMYDYGRIVDDDTQGAVWEMSWEATKHAGGAKKNRLCEAEIVLQAGSYEAVYLTDGSHSFQGWNAARPRDPLSYGMTVRPVAP